jgi:phosphoribosylamine--glycine ligase
MNVLVLGSGGREHALVWKISQSPLVDRIFAAPGNPGIGRYAELVPLKLTDLDAAADFAAREQIGLTVVGPEQPLAEGVVDLFRSRGLTVFGPTRRAAELEWSKAFAKDFLKRYNIPTAGYATFSSDRLNDAREHLRRSPIPVVLKADGLAAGKGVLICQTLDAALSGLTDMAESRVFGAAGTTVVIEEFMEGEEASVFAVCDGKDYVVLAPAQDHKRVFDADRGKNTGGMGAYAPAPLVTGEILGVVEQRIIRPTLDGMAGEGRPFSGCLYVGLMITPSGPKVVEFNARFGDPETQVVLPLYDGDFAALLLAASRGKLGELEIRRLSPSAQAHAVCVVLASGGYPDTFKTGFPIEGLESVNDGEGIIVFHAGTRSEGKQVLTAGGRVLGVTAAVQGSLEKAIASAYGAVDRISFEGMHFRHDIGKKGLAFRRKG